MLDFEALGFTGFRLKGFKVSGFCGLGFWVFVVFSSAMEITVMCLHIPCDLHRMAFVTFRVPKESV